jgi:hypothetical protein
MDAQLVVLCLLTFVIHLIGVLAYSARIAGVRTGRIAIAFSLFNVLVLVSRASNSFQAPFLSKRIEVSLTDGAGQHLLADFRWLILSATLAVIVGALGVPTFQRIFTRAVEHFYANRSIPRLLLHAFAKGGLSYIRQSVTAPSLHHVRTLTKPAAVPFGVIAMNIAAQAFLTVGTFAALYAGYINPEFRVTAISLSSIINGIATILLFVFIDPHLSVMTDDVMDGRTTEADFRRALVWLTVSRVLGTLLAQLMLVPGAQAIAVIAALL